MARLGKAHAAVALAMDGVGPMTYAGRPMAGIVAATKATPSFSALR